MEIDECRHVESEVLAVSQLNHPFPRLRWALANGASGECRSGITLSLRGMPHFRDSIPRIVPTRVSRAFESFARLFVAHAPNQPVGRLELPSWDKQVLILLER
jgi:hypothetical protein